MYVLERTVHVPDRVPVTVLRAGAEPLELPNRTELSRRHGERWLVIDGTAPNAVVRSIAAPAIVWIARRGRTSVALAEGSFALDPGQYFTTEAGERIEVASGGSRDAGFIGLVPPARLAARLFERTTGQAPVEPLVFLQQGDASALLDALELDRLDRALVSPASESAVAEVGEALWCRLVERQREFEPALARTSGRTVRHKRHLHARLNRVRHLVMRGPVRDYSMRELADVAALSVWHFVRMYGQVFEETPHRFLTRVRLERAAALLATSDASIATVAERLGFENRCAFARLFRSHFGVPASVHRREARIAAAKANGAVIARTATPRTERDMQGATAN